MSETIKFKEAGPGNLLESEYYVFEKDEVISIFKENRVQGSNVFKQIENHEVVAVEMPDDRRIKVHFWPDQSSDRYVMQIIMPEGVEPVLPEKLLSYLKEKEPTQFNRKDG